MPAAHRVASLLKRWLLGSHQGAVQAIFRRRRAAQPLGDQKILAHREVALEAFEMTEPGQPAAPGLGLGAYVGALPADGAGVGPNQQGKRA